MKVIIFSEILLSNHGVRFVQAEKGAAVGKEEGVYSGKIVLNVSAHGTALLKQNFREYDNLHFIINLRRYSMNYVPVQKSPPQNETWGHDYCSSLFLTPCCIWWYCCIW